MNKYRNIKTVADGITFDSRKEANRYFELKMLERAHKISKLILQKTFVLQEGFVDDDGKKVRPITYKADFEYYDIEKQKTVIEDVKSPATRKDKVYQLKKKMMARKGHQIVEV